MPYILSKIYLWVHHAVSSQPWNRGVNEVSHMARLGDHNLWIAKYNINLHEVSNILIPVNDAASNMFWAEYNTI
jgi:hypothetical protein